MFPSTFSLCVSQSDKFNVSVGSRAGFICGSGISLPFLKIIFIIIVIIDLRRCYTSTFSVDIENSNGFSIFPSTFSLSAKSIRQSGGRAIVFTRVKLPPIFYSNQQKTLVLSPYYLHVVFNCFSHIPAPV